MSLAAGALWVTGVTLLFLTLATAAVSIRASASRDIFAQLCCQLVAYSLGLFALLRVYGPDLPIRKFVGLRRTHLAFYPLAAGLGVAVALPANYLFELGHQLFPKLDVPTDVAEVFFEASIGGRVAIGVAVLLAAPLVEEVVFRGALFGPLRRTHHVVTVVVGTGAYFALVHLDPHAMLPIFVVGVALGFVRWASGSLIPAVLLHAGFNAVPLVSMALGERPAPPGGAIETPLLPMLLSLVVAVGLLLAVRHVARLDAARVARSRDEQA